MGPAVDGPGFAGDWVIESVAEEHSAVGDSYFFVIPDFDFLFTIVVVHFQRKIVDNVRALRMVVSGSSNFNFRANRCQRLLHFCLLAQSVGRKVVALSSIRGRVLFLNVGAWGHTKGWGESL